MKNNDKAEQAEFAKKNAMKQELMRSLMSDDAYRGGPVAQRDALLESVATLLTRLSTALMALQGEDIVLRAGRLSAAMKDVKEQEKERQRAAKSGKRGSCGLARKGGCK